MLPMTLLFSGGVGSANTRLSARSVPAQAAPTAPSNIAWPKAIRGTMQRLGTVEWRLRAAAVDLCPSRSSGIGIILDDADAYPARDRPLLRRSLGLGSLPQVAGVAPDSPAQKAGLHEGDELVAIGPVTTAAIRAGASPRQLMTDRLEERLAGLSPGEEIVLTVHRADRSMQIAVTPARVCAARFILKSDAAMDAYSDENNLAVTAGMVAFTRTDDELALITAHELGHIVARDGKAPSLSARRAMEDRADLLGVALAACAGYDVPSAFAFWERFDKRDWRRWLRDPSHRSVPARLARMKAVPLPPRCPPTVPPLAD